MKTKYVYIIRFKHEISGDGSKDFECVYRVYSSLRKAQDCLECYKEIYTAKLLNAGYDIERDVDHWVDYREDGHYSYLCVKDGCDTKTYAISREILF